MTENYLHLVWKRKRLPFQALELTDGRSVTIHNCGTHNKLLAGPDFAMGEISIDGIRFVGPIELHVRSSDWERHRHTSDPAYQNVILHVVYEDDAPLFLKGQAIPTLELKRFLDPAHFDKYLSRMLRTEDFPCRNSIIELVSPYLESMKAKAMYERMENRSSIFRSMKYSDRFHVLYYSLASAFGAAVNKQGFERLVQRVPYYALKELNVRSKFQLLMVESAIWSESSSAKANLRVWNHRGTRPANFPEIRVQQFAQLASRYDFDTAFLHLSAGEIESYFRKVIDEIWCDHQSTIPKPTLAFQNHLLINAISPFIWFCAQEYGDSELAEKALELLERLPAESNSIQQKWKNVGIRPENAYDSQALLALYRLYCSRKKCLSCEVGNKVLNRVK